MHMRDALRKFASRVRTWLKRYERFVVPAALISGFAFDTQVFTRVDLLWNDLLLIAYLAIAALGIALLSLAQERVLHGWVTATIAAVMPLAVQFSFGSLFKGLIIFYGKSASLATSWIFVVVLVLLLVFSEVFIHTYRRFRYQVSLLFFLLLAYDAFYLPILVGRISPTIFLASVVMSLVIIVAYLVLLTKVLPSRIRRSWRFFAAVMPSIAAAFVLLYALNAIPPLPLSLVDASVAHAVAHTGDTYQLSVEATPWYAWYRSYDPVVNAVPGSAIYVYTSVFAPTKFRITVEHQWQEYDAAAKAWRTTDTVSFPVAGGRESGYRGYTMKRDLAPGAWRVNVITREGVLLGRVNFTVRDASSTPPLTTVTY